MFDTYSLSIAEQNKKQIQSMWGKTNRVCFVSFCVSKHISAQLCTAVRSCVGTCASVSGHLLFTGTNTDGEVSPSVSGDEMQPRVKHGGNSFSLQLQVHFLLRRVYTLCVRKYFQDETNCSLLCWRILNISSLLNGI